MNTLTKLIALLRATPHPLRYLRSAWIYHKGIVRFVDKEYSSMLWCNNHLRMNEWARSEGWPV